VGILTHLHIWDSVIALLQQPVVGGGGCGSVGTEGRCRPFEGRFLSIASELVWTGVDVDIGAEFALQTFA
jgi:hypothetical protein